MHFYTQISSYAIFFHHWLNKLFNWNMRKSICKLQFLLVGSEMIQHPPSVLMAGFKEVVPRFTVLPISTEATLRFT